VTETSYPRMSGDPPDRIEVESRNSSDWPRHFGFTARFGRVEATPETIGQRFAGFTVDDVGALAEFLKHCAGYAREFGTALTQSTWPNGTK
jgi:hypothetical protein